jgi:HlyD family secretion protein
MKIKSKRIVIPLILILVFAISIIFITHKKETKNTIETVGIIEATEINLSSKITEKINKIYFKEGDYIKEGNVAIILDQEKKRAEYEQSEANLEVTHANLLNVKADIEHAKTNLLDAKKDFERTNILFKEGSETLVDKEKQEINYDLKKTDLLKYQSLESLAKATIKQAEANLKLAKENLLDTTITSPISGIVTYRAFEPGEFVNAGSSILTIIDTKNIWARADIEETKISKIKLGDDAQISLEHNKDLKYIGKIFEINTEGEFATQRDVRRGKQDIKTFRVKIKIEDKNEILKPGMTVLVSM